MSETPMLDVTGLRVAFPTARGEAVVVDDLRFTVAPGESLGIVGESGSGKSMTSLAIMGLLPKSARRTGSIRFGDRELTGLPDNQLRRLRGRDIAMIFQDPLSSLNPYYTVGLQIAETYCAHHPGTSRADARKVAVEAMDRVRIPRAAARLKDYPHQFSGGMRQRVMIAIAMCNQPSLLIADEPTTALDVTVQAQVLELMDDLRRETGAGLILITHDLGVVSESADRIIVMRGGVCVEQGTTEQVFSAPRHDYTQRLLKAIPRIDDDLVAVTPGSGPSERSLP